jgi:predicted NUDIX family phosphoesterase/deoxycytidine triphosphate deaminase
LLELPSRRRIKVNIENGFEVRAGSSVLIHLNEKLNPSKSNEAFDFIKASPKSSIGRWFATTRLLSDYNDSFDEISRWNENDLDLWTLFQPIPKGLIIYPHLSLTQLRFQKGDPKLTNDEIREEYVKTPFLYDKESNLPITDIKITDGLPINIDLEGRATFGVVGLRMRKNPFPIDLSKKDEYVPEDHFEPIMARDGVKFTPGNYYLLASREVLSIPPHLSAELRRYSHEGLQGKHDDAGFIDNNWLGDLVSELTPFEEITSRGKEMPASRIDLFRTSEMPDKLYGGEGVGSNYRLQTGPRVGKHCKPFDFATASKNYEKLSKIVLVQDKKTLLRHRKSPEGFEFMDLGNADNLFSDIGNGFFHSRYDCEEDPLILQFIPYVLFFGQDEIFSYIRSDNIKHYGESKLFGNHSIGVGGHILKSDGPDYARNCLEREALTEEIKIQGNYSEPVFAGTLYATDKPVDRVHFGLIYAIHTDGKIEPNENSIIHSEMIPIEKMRGGYYKNNKTETWTKILIPHLREIYDLSRR